MAGEFDRLFGRLPPSLVRHEDGAIRADISHPAVQFVLQAIRACRDAGDSDEIILHHMMRGMEEGLARMRGDDGR
jgi:hypothetical protein